MNESPRISWQTSAVALQTIVSNEVVRIMRVWTQAFLPSIVTMTLYFVIFGQFIGERIPRVDGVTFMQFIMPGLIMMTIITNSFTNVVGSFFIARFQNSVDELLVAPVPNYILLLGYVLGGVVRGIIVAILVAIIALFFTHIHFQHFFIMFIITLFTAALFSLAGFTNAVFSRNFDDIQIIPTFILTPLTYLGGVFFSIHQLPDFWQKVSLLNPIIYIINAFRYSILGVTDIPIVYAFIIIFGCTIGLFVLNIYLLRKGIGIKS